MPRTSTGTSARTGSGSSRANCPRDPLWVFDEIHKYRRWRNYLKGLCDGRPRGQRILVTGSGRLDLYRFGGDSLQGRYHLLRLHPFSAAELGMSRPSQLLDLLRLARKFDLSAYDASYLALALELRMPIACSDGALKSVLTKAGVKLA